MRVELFQKITKNTEVKYTLYYNEYDLPKIKMKRTVFNLYDITKLENLLDTKLNLVSSFESKNVKIYKVPIIKNTIEYLNEYGLPNVKDIEKSMYVYLK